MTIYLPVKVFVDKKGEIFLSENSVTKRTKHISTRYHVIREHVVNKVVVIIFVQSSENRADVFTKNVSFVGKGTGGELLPETLGQKTSNFITGAPEKIKDYVTDGNFVGDVGKGVTTSLIMQEIAGDPEEMFAGGGVAGQPISEAAQGNYMRDVGPSAMAATGMTRMPSFQELSQQTLYGTGAPNFMSQFYQPLATPRMG